MWVQELPVGGKIDLKWEAVFGKVYISIFVFKKNLKRLGKERKCSSMDEYWSMQTQFSLKSHILDFSN